MIITTRLSHIYRLAKLSIAVFLSLLAVGQSICAQTKRQITITPEIERSLCIIDSLLIESPRLSKETENRIKLKTDQFNKSVNQERRYWLAAELYDEYSTFDSDSALSYAGIARDIAYKLNRNDWITDMDLNMAYIYSATGLLDEAYAAMNRVNEKSLTQDMIWKYCDRVLFLNTHRDQYIGTGNSISDYSSRIDSLLQHYMPTIKVDDPNYTWFIGWASLKNVEQAEQVIPKVKTIVDNSNLNTREDARNAWVLAKLYELTGDSQNKLQYLLKSAIADVRISNREIASLEEIGAILYELEDYEHANSYITYSMACANRYKSRVRLGNLANLQDLILNAIHNRSEKQARQNKLYLAVLIILIAILIIAMIYIARQMQMIARARKTLSQTNAELCERLAELQQTRVDLATSNRLLSERNSELRKAADDLSHVNEAKEKQIANMFGVCSNYINKLDDYRKNIYRLLVAHKYDDLFQLTKSPELWNVELKEFYRNFDRVFLEIYPDFIEDFNSLLRPEERISINKEDGLTTELRIYALVRLGVNDSTRIADFLHVSVRTVYNIRHRARNKATGPKDNFANIVQSLGKFEL